MESGYEEIAKISDLENLKKELQRNFNELQELKKNNELQELKNELHQLKRNYIDYIKITDKKLKYLNLNIGLCMKIGNVKFIANKFHISNFPGNYDKIKLYQYFAKFGVIKDINIFESSNAYITYDSFYNKDELLFGKHVLEKQNVKVSNTVEKIKKDNTDKY